MSKPKEQYMAENKQRLNEDYATSIDYAALFDLLHEGREIVCFVEYEGICMDICRARIRDEWIQISARGVDYGFMRNPNHRELFIQDCVNTGLQFLPPTKASD